MTTGGVMVVLALAVVFAQGAEVTFVRCPNGSLCPDRTTCCLLSSGQYGCCPYQFALCCSDHVHCCPEGYRCNLSNGTCLQISTSVKQVETLMTPMVLLPQQFDRKAQANEGARCPDGHSCNDGQTCCLLSSGKYGCCPFPHAVCCSDHASCCPEGYRCQVSTRTCIAGNSTLPMLKKISTVGTILPEEPTTVSDVECPDGGSCEDGQTCCLMKNKSYGCCSYPDATCCADDAHCCPNGYVCDAASASCRKEGDVPALALKKVPARRRLTPVQAPLKRVRCPDGNYCQDTQTCCLTTGGSFGCCPYPHAECCSDHASCCPEGYRCQLSTRSCVAGNSTVAMLKKVSTFSGLAQDTLNPVQDSQCEDGSSCPSGMLCCLAYGNTYACCLGADSVCCPGRGHCCKHGYKCATTRPSCVPDNATHVAMEKVLAPGIKLRLPTVSVSDVECPDGGSCEDGQTCCLMKNLSYECCSYPDATCCADDTCCPNGYVCDVASASCRKEGDVLALALKKAPARRRLMPVQATLLDTDNTCKDGHVCPGETTCCPTPSGRYDCCPFASGVCCPDGEHCCPQSFQCDQHKGSCVRGTFYPFLKEMPMLPKFLSWLNRP